jgi:hypothetical protein
LGLLTLTPKNLAQPRSVCFMSEKQFPTFQNIVVKFLHDQIFYVVIEMKKISCRMDILP